MTPNEFIEETKKLNINITEEQQKKLDLYADFLLEYNKHTNLTAIKTKEEVYLKHFYDSLTLTKIASFSHETILDIGTGAGFPGLVIAIIFPNTKVTLLDSNNKKIKFLEEITTKLNQQNVTIINSRAEEYTKNHREKYDYVTGRAVADLRILLELSLPALKVNSSFLVMKANIEEELAKSQKTLEILSAKIISKEEFYLPNNGGKRTLLKIVKEKPTLNKYPRKYDKIKNQPLK